MSRRFTFFCLALAVLLLPLTARAASGLLSWNENNRKDWWAKYPTPDTWPQAADALQSLLEANYKQNGVHVFDDSDFRNWLEHLEWIRLGIASPAEIADPADLKTFLALAQDDSVSHLLIEKLDPLDVPTKALDNLLRLSKANNADLHEYAALGVAFALVFDQPFPAEWPHSQVKSGATPIGDTDVVSRFNFYVQANRNKKTDLDLTKLPVEYLKFVVDSEVTLTELAYGQKEDTSYSQFSNVYFSIVYDRKRINKSETIYVWPGDTYTLDEISKKGGICVDQAYYGCMIGKARGIPTIRFSGFGMDGAHAWMGYLSSSRKWELDVGRYEQQDFPKGFAVDPQTWQAIDDATLENLFVKGLKNPNYQPATTALNWANQHQDNAVIYAQILADAHSIMPEWSGTWRLQAAQIDKGGNMDLARKFYKDWVAQFGNFPEMKVEGQKRLYHDLKAANDPGADEQLQSIIAQNRGEGFEFGIEASAEAIQDKLKDDNWDDARALFERSIRDFGRQGGLTLYLKIVRPYIETLLQNGQASLAGRAISYTQDRMSMNADSQVGEGFAELKEKVAAAKKNETSSQ